MINVSNQPQAEPIQEIIDILSDEYMNIPDDVRSSLLSRIDAEWKNGTLSDGLREDIARLMDALQEEEDTRISVADEVVASRTALESSPEETAEANAILDVIESEQQKVSLGLTSIVKDLERSANSDIGVELKKRDDESADQWRNFLAS